MSEGNFTYDYYIIGVRPVKINYEDGKLRGSYALNWENCEFELDQTYLSRIRHPHMEESNISVFDIKEVDRDEFDKQVEALKAKKKLEKKAASSDKKFTP
ncbi:MAG: hypothetical protein N4A43_01470 [Alphaproteobacteria bacterium]|jgi:hypothetical protein|nr:hypothetical protein [Alphaproteobacteria bacterium]